eukprot:scaffold245068_cov16-Prasinocladus_malaysianus.AAC.1
MDSESGIVLGNKTSMTDHGMLAGRQLALPPELSVTLRRALVLVPLFFAHTTFASCTMYRYKQGYK